MSVSSAWRSTKKATNWESCRVLTVSRNTSSLHTTPSPLWDWRWPQLTAELALTQAIARRCILFCMVNNCWKVEAGICRTLYDRSNLLQFFDILARPLHRLDANSWNFAHPSRLLPVEKVFSLLQIPWSVSFHLVVTEAGSNCCLLLFKAPGGNTEKNTVSLVNTREINVNTAVVAVF